MWIRRWKRCISGFSRNSNEIIQIIKILNICVSGITLCPVILFSFASGKGRRWYNLKLNWKKPPIRLVFVFWWYFNRWRLQPLFFLTIEYALFVLFGIGSARNEVCRDIRLVVSHCTLYSLKFCWNESWQVNLFTFFCCAFWLIIKQNMVSGKKSLASIDSEHNWCNNRSLTLQWITTMHSIKSWQRFFLTEIKTIEWKNSDSQKWELWPSYSYRRTKKKRKKMFWKKCGNGPLIYRVIFLLHTHTLHFLFRQLKTMGRGLALRLHYLHTINW